MKRNGEIDFFRFIFAVSIVIFHFNDNFKLSILYYGNIAVEFFFLVSGFLLAKHAEGKAKYRTTPPQSYYSNETWNYLMKKVNSFYKYYLGAFILQIVVRFVLIRKESFSTIIYNLLKSIPVMTLSFMGISPSTSSFYIGNTWYLSSLLISILILYPLLLKRYDFSVKIIFPLTALFILGYFYNTYGTLNAWQDWSGLFYSGIIRAVGEVAMGCCLYPVFSFVIQKYSEILQSRKLTTKILWTLIKYGCYAIVLVYATGSIGGIKFEKSFCFHAMLFCAAGILLSFSNAGYTIPNCKFTRYLGRISLPIFIYHGFIRWSVKNYIDLYRPELIVTRPLFFVLVVLAVIVSVLLMHITDFLSITTQRLYHKT